MLLGLVRPTAGSAIVLGAPPGSPESLALVGALIESPTFYPFLSGRDNLRVLARYSGTPEARIEAVLEEVDLAARARRPVRHLLARHEAAAGNRGGVAQGSGAADPRRAHERHGPCRYGGDARLHSRARPRSADGAPLQPPHGRGRAGLRPRRRDQQGEDRQGGNRGRAARTRDACGCGPSRWKQAERVLRAARRWSRWRGWTAGSGSRPILRPRRTLNRTLVEAGIEVAEIRPERDSLEKIFLELTQGGEDQ